MTTALDDLDEVPEPYLLKGEQRFRPIPQWHWRIQRYAMALARQLDEWHGKLDKPAFETFNHAGFRLRDQPPTSIRLPLSVVRGQFPTFESDWIPAIPLVAVEVFVGADTFGALEERIDEYLECGVSVVWVMAPDWKTITVHRCGESTVGLDGRDELTGDSELPGFSCRVADLFR